MKEQNVTKKMTRQESLLFLKSCKSSLEGVINSILNRIENVLRRG